MEEERQVTIINLLKENVPNKVATRIKLLEENLNLNKNEIDENEENQVEQKISQVDVNKFNAKFEFYTGETVSFENVKTLLGIVKENISDYEITPIVSESKGNSSKDEKYNIKLYIEQNKQNEEAITNVLEKINERGKYKVSISYKEENGLIDYITINEVEN